VFAFHSLWTESSGMASIRIDFKSSRMIVSPAPSPARLRKAPKYAFASMCGGAKRALAGIALGFVLSTIVTGAIGASDGEMRPFNIVAQPLSEALQAYSKAANVQVMFEADSTDGYRSAPVHGKFAPEAALQLLLGKTNLKVRYIRSDVITLSAPSSQDADQPPIHGLGMTAPDMALDVLRIHGTAEAPADGQLTAYVSVIQGDIQRALKKVARLRDKDYHVGVKLWVDSDRVVQKAELFRSTGDTQSDVVIASALHGLALSEAAPANIPLPIRFMIEIHSF
jgi:hypothetical protein